MKNELQKLNIQHFLDCLSSARLNVQKAGEELVKILDANPETAYEDILRESKRVGIPVSLRLLEVLELVGRGKLNPLLLTDPSPAAQRAIDQRLSIQDQKRLISQTIPVVVSRNGGFEVVNKRCDEVKAHESVRAIKDGRIQTVEEQTEILRQQSVDRAAHSARYMIEGGKVTFFENVTFSWSELMEIAEKVKPKARDIESSIKRRQVEK